MKHETAGDPITGLKWTRRTTAKVADELRHLGIEVSANTVARLLKTMGFSLRVNHKKKSNGSPQNRNAQFVHIGDLRQGMSQALLFFKGWRTPGNWILSYLGHGCRVG